MSLHRDQLVFMALCVLQDACLQAERGKVPRTQGLRFALAYLYAIGDRRREHFDREPYDAFWRRATVDEAIGGGVNGSLDGYCRRRDLDTAMKGIARAAGIELEPSVMEVLIRACRRAEKGPTSF